MSRIDSLSAYNSRSWGTGTSSSGRNKAIDSPYINNARQAARSDRIENSGKIKLDKVSVSEEAKNLQYNPSESVAKIYNRLEKYRY